jgi:CheY-like chemotaxis protein
VEVLEEKAAETVEPDKVIIGYKGERKRILIVDDNITNLSMLVSLLEPLGFEIETAKNGQDAIREMRETKSNIVLLDLLMPEMDGDAALKMIRKEEGLKAVKVIGVSAAVADRVRTDAFAADCDDFISKPVKIEVLLEKLEKHLQLEWIEEQAASDATGLASIGELKPEKIPYKNVLDRIIETAERGDFTRLETILEKLEAEDAAYGLFCNQLREFAKKYDNEGIIEYIKTQGERCKVQD